MNKILALDLGVTSCGFSVLDEVNNNQYKLIDYGVVMRDNPIDSGTQSDWKGHIQQRKLIDGRQKRVELVKQIFDSFSFKFEVKNYSNLWELRTKDAFERKLDTSELFAIFRFLAKHRGYKSLKMEDLIAEIQAEEKIADCKNEDIIEPDSEDFNETLAYLDALKCKYKEKTVAQIIWQIESEKKNPNFRNHNNYKYMIRREDVEAEISKIIEAQEKFGFFESNEKAEEFKKLIINEIIPQKSVKLNDELINKCLIHKNEKSAPIYSYTFDIFNFYKHINDLKIGKENATNDQKKILINDFETKLKELNDIPAYTVKEIKKLLDIKEDIKVSGLRETKIVKGKPVQNSLVKFNFLAHISKFDKAIMQCLQKDIKYFDKLASIFHININPNDLIKEFIEYFKENGFSFKDEQVKEFVLSLHKYKVKGTTAYSFKALNELLIHMKDGNNESSAKEILGVSKREDYSTFKKGIKYLKPMDKSGILQYEIDENTISNHVVKSLISWACRVVIDLHEKYGPFDVIKLESTKELSLPEDKKREIKKGNDNNQKEWEDLKKRYKSHFDALGLNINNNKEYLLKIKLWEQQEKIGMYSGKSIGIADILSDKTEIEHIVPRECGGVNAEYNKAIDTKHENALKGRRLPLDYLVGEKREVFLKNIDELKRAYKINFKKWLNLKAETLDDTFKEVKDDTSMHATSYMEKLLGEILKRYYPFSEVQKENQKVMHISGRATSYLRKILSIENKSRYTNFHHAEDAILIGCMSRSYLQNISTNFEKNYELDKLKAKEHFKKIVPLIDGANPNEVFSHIRESYEKDIENNPFYKNMVDRTIRVPAFWVSKKPIGTEVHKSTIQQDKEFNPYYVPYSKFIDDFLKDFKLNHKTNIDKFISNYDEKFLNKVFVYVTNPNDFNSKAFVAKKNEIIEVLKKASFATSKDEKSKIDDQLRNIIKIPIKDVNGKSLRRIRRIGEKSIYKVRRGISLTSPSMLGLLCSFIGEIKLRLYRVDVKDRSKFQNISNNSLDIYNNDLIEIYIFEKKQVTLKEIGILRTFVIDTKGNTMLKVKNPKYPVLEKHQPKKYNTYINVKKMCGIKKYKTDASGKVLGFYYLGRVLDNQRELFSKVISYRKI